MQILALALTVSALGTPSSSETITFAVPAGVSVEKIWTTQHTLRTADMNRSLGQESRAYRMRLDGISSEEILGALDQYEQVDGGRPTKFRRSYTKGRRVSQLFNERGSQPKIRQRALLRGNSAMFTWVPEEGIYGKYFDREELDEDMLAYLRGDLDLIFALPEVPVSPGDRWELTPAELIDLFGRSGTFPYEIIGDKDDFLIRALDSGLAGSLDQAFGGTAEGRAEVHFKEIRESDAGREAILEIGCQVAYERDRTAFVRANTIRKEQQEGIDYQEAFLRLLIEGRGTIVWNLDEQRPTELAFEGTETTYIRIVHRAPTDEEGVNRAQDVTMKGSLTIGASYTRLP